MKNKKIGNALFLQFMQNDFGGIWRFQKLSRKEKINYKRRMTTWYNRPQEQKEKEWAELRKRSAESFASTLGISVEELMKQYNNNI